MGGVRHHSYALCDGSITINGARTCHVQSSYDSSSCYYTEKTGSTTPKPSTVDPKYYALIWVVQMCTDALPKLSPRIMASSSPSEAASAIKRFVSDTVNGASSLEELIIMEELTEVAVLE